MVLGQSAGYIKLWSSLAKSWRRLWSELSYLGPQDYLPSSPKRLGPVIPRRWYRSGWNRDASAAAADYANTQAASDACATCLVRPHIGTGWLLPNRLKQFPPRRDRDLKSCDRYR